MADPISVIYTRFRRRFARAARDEDTRGIRVLLSEIKRQLHSDPGAPHAEEQAAMTIPKDSQERKDAPVFSGALKYFPDALVLVAMLSKRANDKHNPGEAMHWSKEKSNDHMDCLVRHALEVGMWDADNKCDHAVAVAWRALANLQTMIENGTIATDQKPTIRPGTVTVVDKHPREKFAPLGAYLDPHTFIRSDN